ncbi:MAG: rod shape-determining protein MreC [Bacillota bacterium]
MGNFVKHRWLVLGTVAVLFAFTLVARTSSMAQEPGTVSRVVVAIGLPVQKGIRAIARGVGSVGSLVASIAARESELEMLRKKADSAQALAARVIELEQEVNRLRTLLGYTPDPSVKAVVASVVARHPDSWFAKVYIDRGSLDGVSKNHLVVTDSGLVGRVTAVYPTAARVSLVIDPEVDTGALVQRSGEPGLVVGAMSSARMLHLRLFSRDADVKPGDTVVTSGLGVTFPRGVVIGYVKEVRFEENGLVKVADVLPCVDYNRLSEVLVLQPQGRRGQLDVEGLK